MSSYDYNGFVRSFSDRTNKNLKLIEYVKQGKLKICVSQKSKRLIPVKMDTYEVTQLINSLFGLLVVPQEIFKEDMWELNEKANENNVNSNNSEYDYKKGEDYTALSKIVADLAKNKCLQTTYSNYYDPVISFIWHLRNALSHSGTGLHFTPVSKHGQIEKVYFYDQYIQNKGKSNEKYKGEFCALLTIDEIKLIIKHINGFYIAWEANHNYKSEERYNKEVQIYADFLKDKSNRCYARLDELEKENSTQIPKY